MNLVFPEFPGPGLLKIQKFEFLSATLDGPNNFLSNCLTLGSPGDYSLYPRATMATKRKKAFMASLRTSFSPNVDADEKSETNSVEQPSSFVDFVTLHVSSQIITSYICILSAI